ncbi:MAG: ABC transporter ATP-binding protein [Muribaculaceae bacterium]|nr:ABC transporter ATP-binding protein [Muribaculaceae bacterium]
MASIELQNLSTGYRSGQKQTVIADSLNAVLKNGELTALLGPNGAGKSTLMRTICGFIPRVAGEILVNGTDVRKIKPSHLAKEVAVVLTERPDAENMTLREMVALGRIPYTGFFGRLSEEDYIIVDEALETIGIRHLENRKVVSLSDGERQKGMIAKALAQQTDIIILDEPTAFLDFPGKIEIFRLLNSLAHENNKAILLSTHDMEAILQIADTLWLLDKKLGLTTGNTRLLAQSGEINRYFSKKGVTFDPSSCHFNIS